MLHPSKLKNQKKYFLLPLVIIFFGLNILNAQFAEKNAFYHSSEFNAGNYPVNWEYRETSLLVANFTYDYTTYSTLSFIFNPKIEFPFTRYYGFTLSPLIHVNKTSNFYGIGIGHMVGLLRRKNQPKENNE